MKPIESAVGFIIHMQRAKMSFRGIIDVRADGLFSITSIKGSDCKSEAHLGGH